MSAFAERRSWNILPSTSYACSSSYVFSWKSYLPCVETHSGGDFCASAPHVTALDPSLSLASFLCLKLRIQTGHPHLDRARWAFPIPGHPLPPADQSTPVFPGSIPELFSFPITGISVSKRSLILPALLDHSLLLSDGDQIPDMDTVHSSCFVFFLSLRWFNLLSQGGITSCLSLFRSSYSKQ